MSVVDGSSEAGTRRRNRRLDLRITQSERELIERAIATTGSGLTEFVVGSAVETGSSPPLMPPRNGRPSTTGRPVICPGSER